MSAFRRGLGWVPDPEPSDEERARHGARVGALRAGDPAVLPFTRAPWILDQLDSEACTMHEAVEALYALTGFLGSPWPGWWLARHADLLPGQRDVANVGVSTYAALRTMERHGIPPWDVWHPGMERFSYSAAPPALARTGGQGHRLNVTPIWTDPEEGVRAALSRGLPCGIVVEVDPAFEAASGGRVPAESGASRGKHMLTLWPFRSPEEADGEPLLVNSWGPSWGDRGTARVSWDRIRSAPFLCFSELAT
jgi:hypothetical protein